MVNETDKELPLLTKVKLGVYVILCGGAVIAMASLLVFHVKNFHSLSREEFHCTRVEQVGKGLDQVVCVQYTHNRFFRDVIEPPAAVRQGSANVAPTQQNNAAAPVKPR